MNLLKSEWIKLTSTKSAYWLYGLGLVFAVAMAALFGWLITSVGSDEFTAEAPADSGTIFLALTGVSTFTFNFVLIAAIVAVTGEYRYHTFRSTFLAVPKRWTVIAAKTGLLAVCALVVVALAVMFSLLVGGALSKDSSWTPFSGDGLDLLWKYPVYVALGTIFAVGLALIMRNAAGAISLLLVWTLAVESLVTLIPKIGKDLAGWMPFANGNYWVQGAMVKGNITWSEPTAIVYFAIVCLVVWVAGVVITLRRDA